MLLGVQGPNPQLRLAVAISRTLPVGPPATAVGVTRGPPPCTHLRRSCVLVGPTASRDTLLAPPGLHLTSGPAEFQFPLKEPKALYKPQGVPFLLNPRENGSLPWAASRADRPGRPSHPESSAVRGSQGRRTEQKKAGGGRTPPRASPDSPRAPLQPPERHLPPLALGRPASPCPDHTRSTPPTASQAPGAPRPALKDSLQSFHQKRLPHTRGSKQQTHSDPWGTQPRGSAPP